MNILVTGAAGLLGANILYLLRDSHNIVGMDRNPMAISRTITVVSQLQDMQLLGKIIDKYQIKTVIHCAAMTNVDECERHPQQAILVNKDLVDQIVLLCARKRVKVVFISSDAVYNGELTELHKETEVATPVSVYGKTKLAAENIVLSNRNNLVFRTNMYGFNYREKESFSEWIIKQLSQDAQLNMFYDCLFSPLLVNTLVDLINQAIKKDLSGLYNLCATGSISKYQMGCMIKNVFSLRGIINRVSMDDFCFFAPRTHNMGMDNSKIQKDLGVSIETIEDGVRKYYELCQEGYKNKLRNI